MILLPENCLIQNNRLIRPRGGASITGPALDTKPPLDRFPFKPNTYTNNLLLGGVNAYPPAENGFQRESIPKGWTEESERASLHPLTPADVGPDWMISKSTTNP
jgi:poly(beta-D-mannuronate) lyase